MVVDVASREEFNDLATNINVLKALVGALQERVVKLEAKELPAEVKEALAVIIAYLQALTK